MELLNMFFGIFLFAVLLSTLIIVPYVIFEEEEDKKDDGKTKRDNKDSSEG